MIVVLMSILLTRRKFSQN